MQVKGKKIAKQFSNFVEARKESDKANMPFAEKLMRKAGKQKRHKEHESGFNLSFSKQRAVRRHQPPPVLGRSKKISKTHARRLARYAPYIQRAAVKYGVPVELICGVILQESGGNYKAVSHCGARGLMQLMPATARRFGVKNSFDPAQNIDGGTRYLGWLLKEFKGDVKLALAGYNSGEHNVKKYGNKIPPFKETQNYVPCVLGFTQSMIDIFVAKTTVLPSYARRA